MIYTLKELEQQANYARKSGRRIVVVTGTFDMFHVGHLNIIRDAKENPKDFLIVAVKSDRAAALKKEHPPIIHEWERAAIVEAVRTVDAVVIVDYDPERKISLEASFSQSQLQWLNIFEPLVKKIKPDIFVHEASHLQPARDALFAKYGVVGKIHPRTQGVSTSDIISKICNVYGNNVYGKKS